jgi:hypothetical protein
MQTDISPKQIEIEYLLCNTNTKTYVTKITTNLKIMEKDQKKKNIKIQDNFFIIEPQKLIK